MWKKVWIFSPALSELWKLVNFRTFCAKKLFKDFICFICRIREVHFSELVMGFCHLSAARRQIGRKTAVFWSVKNWIWSGKSQWKVREFCFCMRVATLYFIPASINYTQLRVGSGNLTEGSKFETRMRLGWNSDAKGFPILHWLVHDGLFFYHYIKVFLTEYNQTTTSEKNPVFVLTFNLP